MIGLSDEKALELVRDAPAPRPERHAPSHVHVYTPIWIALINADLHLARALRRQFDGRPVLWRMTPMTPPCTEANPPTAVTAADGG